MQAPKSPLKEAFVKGIRQGTRDFFFPVSWLIQFIRKLFH